jgi:hypothetical protein
MAGLNTPVRLNEAQAEPVPTEHHVCTLMDTSGKDGIPLGAAYHLLTPVALRGMQILPVTL